MDASLANLTFRYRLEFARPVVEIAVQSGRVLEEIVAQLSAKFTVVASDLRVRSGSTVVDHGVRVTLFNGLDAIDLTVEHRMRLQEPNHTARSQYAAGSTTGNTGWPR